MRVFSLERLEHQTEPVPSREPLIFGSNSSLDLATRIAGLLRCPLGCCTIDHLPNGGVNVQLVDSVQARSVFLVQSICRSLNDRLADLLALANACCRASAATIVAVIPHFESSSHELSGGHDTAESMAIIADVLHSAGVGHVITLDVDVPQSAAADNISLARLPSLAVLARGLRSRLSKDTVVVAPNRNAINTAQTLAQFLGMPLISTEEKVGRMELDSESMRAVLGRPCLVVDETIYDGGIVRQTVEALLRAGSSTEIYAAAIHGHFSRDALDQLNHPALRKVFITDSLPIPEDDSLRISVISLAPMFAATIRACVFS